MNHHDVSWSQAAEDARIAEYQKYERMVGEETIFSKLILTIMLLSTLATPWAVVYLIALSGGVK